VEFRFTMIFFYKQINGFFIKNLKFIVFWVRILWWRGGSLHLVVSEQVKPFSQWVMSLLYFSVHFLVALLNAWCMLFAIGSYSLCCLSMCCRNLIVVVITCLVSWCLLYHEFQCRVMSYQTGHLYNLWSAMGWYGKRSGNTNDRK